jgi:hypothetical protein
MTGDRKNSDIRPFIFAATTVALILIVVVVLLAAGGTGGTFSKTPATTCPCPAGTQPVFATPPALPAVCPAAIRQAGTSPAVPELLASADLELTRPPATDIIPYTDRGFSKSTEASIAWWMSPGFMDNTSEFRMYERRTAEGKAAFPEEHRIFFDFIESGLDDAEQQSVLKNDLVLFRGISPGVASAVLENAEYREPAFASTSYDITLSLDAFGPRSPDGYRNMIVLERHAGDHALYVNEDEREFLLPRGTRWHVVKAVNIENLTVQADFLLHGRNTTSASFDHVRLISVTETCS